MRAYIALSYSHRHLLEKEISQVSLVLKKAGFEVFVFVDNYQFQKEEEKDMMQAACREIDNSHLLVAETSYKEIGIGIEIGYAKGRGMPVIYLRKEAAEHSTTASGISDCQVVYSDLNKLEQGLVFALKALRPWFPV